MSQTKAQLVDGFNINTSVPADSLVIDSSGRLLVGTSTASTQRVDAPAQIQTGSSGNALNIRARSSDDRYAYINLQDSAGSETAASIHLDRSATNAGILIFSTTADGSASPTERMRITNDGSIFAYNLTGSPSAGANLKLISNEIIVDTSSIEFKKDVEDIEEGYAVNLLDNARPVWFRAKDDKQNPEHSHWGFIAEELAEVEPRLCVFEDGAPFSVDYGKFSPLLLKLIQMQDEKIKSLETRLAALEAS